MREFQAPKPGQKLKSSDLRDWLDETKRLNKMSVYGGQFINDATGMHLFFDTNKGFYAKITASGTGGKYSWEAVDLQPDGATWVTALSGMRGSYQTDAAIEMNFSPTVSINTIVYLYPAIVGEALDIDGENERVPLFYVFTTGGGGGGGSSGVSAVQCVGNVLYVTYGT